MAMQVKGSLGICRVCGEPVYTHQKTLLDFATRLYFHSAHRPEDVAKACAEVGKGAQG